MNPVDYYRTRFPRDLQDVAGTSYSSGDRFISLVSLLPDPPPGGDDSVFARSGRRFIQLNSKPLFLFCYFFSSLIDQAIHSALRAEHPHFDHLAKYPKFVGILGTFHTNLHPALLLLTATLYVSRDENEATTRKLEELTDFFLSDYCQFITVDYPRLTGRLAAPADQQAALSALFSSLSSATALLFAPDTLKFSQSEPNLILYKGWLSYVSQRVNERARSLDNTV